MHSSVCFVKAIILKYFRLLVLIRRKDGFPDLPGGHLESSEAACQSLFREVPEETGLVVRWTVPIKRWVLQAGKGALNGMTFFDSEYKKGRVVLSQEHTDYFLQDLGELNQFTPKPWVQGISTKK